MSDIQNDSLSPETVPSYQPELELPAAAPLVNNDFIQPITLSAVKRQRTSAKKPPLKDQIYSALHALRGRKGSTLVSIKNYIYHTYHRDGDKRKVDQMVLKAIKKGVQDGELVKPNSMRYKMSPETVKAVESAQKMKLREIKKKEKSKLKKLQKPKDKLRAPRKTAKFKRN